MKYLFLCLFLTACAIGKTPPPKVVNNFYSNAAGLELYQDPENGIIALHNPSGMDVAMPISEWENFAKAILVKIGVMK